MNNTGTLLPAFIFKNNAVSLELIYTFISSLYLESEIVEMYYTLKKNSRSSHFFVCSDGTPV